MKLVVVTSLACIALLVGCEGSPSPEAEESTQESTEALCGVSFPLESRVSLMVTQPVDDDANDPLTPAEATRLTNVWNAVKTRFTFGRVVSQIRASSGAPAPNSDVKLFHQWMDSYNADPGVFASVRHCDDAGVDPNGFGFECGRPEGALAGSTFDPFTSLNMVVEPVAVVNRFDLAPTSGANCGEHRIIFAMADPTAGVDRLFFIFEAALPNPTPDAGLAGCAPVVDLWQGLSDPALSPGQIANRLEKLYFTGLPGFSPVVAAANYGMGGAGQIRTNQLSTTWTLREFKTKTTCGASCTLSFDEVTTKTNPANDLFNSAHPMSAGFLANFLPNVRKGALGARTAATIKLAVDDTFNTWESNQFETGYGSAADAAFRAAITSKLASEGLALTQKNILDRAQTQSCMGCHQDSNGADLGPKGAGKVTWPSSAGFVHVLENGLRSQALTQSFLPRRRAVLQKFIDAQCAGAQVESDGLTLGGAPLGSAN